MLDADGPIVVEASFAADLLEAPLSIWGKDILGVDDGGSRFLWSPYREGDILCASSNKRETRAATLAQSRTHLLLVRLEDIAVQHPEEMEPILTKKSVKEAGVCKVLSSESTDRGDADMEGRGKGSGRHYLSKKGLDNAADSLSRMVERFDGSRVILLVLPPSPEEYEKDSHRWKAHVAAEERLVENLRHCSGSVHVETSATVMEFIHCNRREYASLGYTRTLDRVAHSPFTLWFYVRLAGFCWRLILRATVTAKWPKKVIALDCDGTLWDGIVGEVGPLSVKFGRASPERLFLQSFMLNFESKRGILLCLCSRNMESDVLNTFRLHQDCPDEWPLSLDKIATTRINWNDKYENLCSIAAELNISLGDFIFVDDSATECLSVSSQDESGGCSGLCVVHIPQSGRSKTAPFLQHHWAFDGPIFAGQVVKGRTRLYRDAKQRRQARESLSRSAFLASLNLSIDIFAPEKHAEMERFSELSARTNKMNVWKNPVTLEQVKEAYCSGTQSVRVVTVSDRFGFHGIVGAMKYHRDFEGYLFIDTFCLSCRSLHLGVEYEMLKHLGL